MVVINGINTPMGRFPLATAANGGFLIFQSHSGANSITSSSLNAAATNWTGATAVVKTYRYRIGMALISSASGGILNFSTPLNDVPVADGFGFFIQNDVRTLTYQNAWYYNSSTKKIRIYCTSSPTSVKIASIDTLVNGSGYIGASFITFENVDFEGSNTSTLQLDHAQQMTVQNCIVNFNGLDGINTYSSDYLTVQNSKNNK